MSDEQSEGQVSEVSALKDPGEGGGGPEPVSEGDAVAGNPTMESGEADSDVAGTDEAPSENQRDNEFKKSDHHHLGENVHDL